MAKAFAILVLLANLLALNCQEEQFVEDSTENHTSDEGKPSYSFSYGVSDTHTGDIKAVWESKEGDTVKGHYSVLEPDGSVRSVEYSAGPKTGFTAVVNNESSPPPAQDIGRSIVEEKSMREYGKYYDFSEDADDEEYYERKRTKRPSDFKDYSLKKRPKYPFDLEPSEYTHSITIKHPRDESSLSESEPHSHVGYSFDPNCKTKTRKESNENKDNLYANVVDLDLSKAKYPIFPPDSFKDDFEKFNEPPHFDFEKLIKSYNNNGHYKGSKYEEPKPSSSMKYSYPALPDGPPPDKYYPDDLPPRPKKKNRPYKMPEFHYPSDDLDDYILVPKKKFKPNRYVEPNDYRPESDDDYERPSYSSFDDASQDERYHSTRGSGPKEVVRKIIKKRRPPVINLLDIFDI